MPESEQKYEVMPTRPEEKPATNLLELLDRILDKGIVIVGDIRISVADIELLKIQIRLLVASVDKAKEIGIDFSWAQKIEGSETDKIRRLESRIKELEGQLENPGNAKELSGSGNSGNPDASDSLSGLEKQKTLEKPENSDLSSEFNNETSSSQ